VALAGGSRDRFGFAEVLLGGAPGVARSQLRLAQRDQGAGDPPRIT
jgi:hypothetical protein